MKFNFLPSQDFPLRHSRGVDDHSGVYIYKSTLSQSKSRQKFNVFLTPALQQERHEVYSVQSYTLSTAGHWHIASDQELC